MFTKKISEQDALKMSSVTLAFVGDAVYTLFVREKLSLRKDYKSGELNKMTTSYVRATAQAEKITALLGNLTENESYVYRRARNAHKPSRAKSASVSEYNKSTGFEALVGYLYLTGDEERLSYVLNFGEEDENRG